MPRCLAALLLSLTNTVWGHPGHGAPEVHSHLWDFGLIAVAVSAVVYFLVRKK